MVLGEVSTILLDLGVILLGSVVGGAIVNLFIHGGLAWRVQSLERKAQGYAGKTAQNESREANEQEMIAAIGEAADLHSQGKSIPEIIKEVGLKHPSVAMRLVKDFMSGKLKLPAGLGGGKMF